MSTLSLKDSLNSKEQKELTALKVKEQRFLNPAVLSDTAKKYLVEVYAVRRYNIGRPPSGYYMNPSRMKGIALESEGREMLSRIDGVEYVKPADKISDDYFIGACDILCPNGTKIIETKTSWNASSFMLNRVTKLDFQDWAQLQGYLHLYNIKQGQVCYILVNSPKHLIEQAASTLFKKYTYGDINRSKYEEDSAKLETFYDYNKIPEKRRVIRFNVDYSPEFIERVKARVVMARLFLDEFERKFMSNKTIDANPLDYLYTSDNEPSTEEPND